MSTTYSLVCHDCKKDLWIAQSSMGGFTFYSGDQKTMAQLEEFLSAHVSLREHRLEFVSEHRLEAIEDQWAAPSAGDAS